MTEAAGTLGSLYTVGDIMSSFKPPMGEGNTGSFDTPFGGKGGPSGESAPPIPPAPKAEGAAFTSPVHSVPKVGEATFTPPAPPKGEGKAFTPPVPPAPNESEEPHTPQEDDKGGKGKDKKDATKSSDRGDSGRHKSTRRMWPWIVAVAVIAVVSGVLGYGYFANEGNNPVGEKLGFSHAKVTDQSTSDPNNGSYTNPSSDANSSQQGQEGQEGSTDGQKSQEGGSSVATRPADDVLKDGDYGKELVNTALDPRTLPETEEARSLKLNVKYKPNRTMQSFLDDCVKFNSDFKTYTGLKDDPNKLWIVTGDARVKYDVSTDTNVDTDDSVKYEYANNSLRMIAMLLAAAYQSGVPDPSADVVVAYALGGKRAVIRGFSLHNSFESYRYKINDTDPELWVQAVYPDGVPEGVQLPPVPAE